MFSGLVKGTTEVISFSSTVGGARLILAARDLDQAAEIGDSIAINGCCLTVVSNQDSCWTFDLSSETLACTTLGNLRPSQRVNIEPALRFGDALDGHLVTGHVDAIGAVRQFSAPEDGHRPLSIRLPSALLPFVAEKGSITIDGVSLTINRVVDDAVEINLIPHTLASTIAGHYSVGQAVNIEVDILARYVARQLAYAEGVR